MAKKVSYRPGRFNSIKAVDVNFYKLFGEPIIQAETREGFRTFAALLAADGVSDINGSRCYYTDKGPIRGPYRSLV